MSIIIIIIIIILLLAITLTVLILFLDLSFQAAQKVMSAPQDKSLEILRDLSQNFPVLAK